MGVQALFGEGIAVHFDIRVEDGDLKAKGVIVLILVIPLIPVFGLGLPQEILLKLVDEIHQFHDFFV